ncbi:MAG: hypothetical protein KBT49_01645, partial [Bacteroidetes bacterium]|nr:hypothetical protein [Candidatus Colenecus caballi]
NDEISIRSAVVTALRMIFLKVSPSQQKSSGSSGGGSASESCFGTIHEGTKKRRGSLICVFYFF